MRAKEFIVETAMMGKIADSGKIIRILKKAHTVPFSDEKNWLLVDTDPGKGNSGLGIKWIPADTRFEWVRPYKDTVDENLTPQTIHKLADRKGVKWDNEPSFLQLTKRLTGKEHLDDLDHSGLNKVKRHLDGLQGVVEGLDEAVGGNYLYHSTQDANTAKQILSSGYILGNTGGKQPASDAQTTLPTVSFGRSIGYQTTGANVDRDYQVVFVFDRTSIETRYKTLGTSQSQSVRGLANPIDTEWGRKVAKLGKVWGLDANADGKVDYKEIGNASKSTASNTVKQAVSTHLNAPKAGGEFEEIVPTKTGKIPLQGLLVGFYLVPGKAASKDPELLNDPRRLDMPRPNQFVKATQAQGVAEGVDPDKKYTIKKSYTMTNAGVEKAVWYIMDGDFVVDATDLRRDAKYYADKWNAAEKDSKNIAQKPTLEENLNVDVPNEEWLQNAIDYAIQKSPDRNGLPYMGKTTATAGPVEVSVSILKRIPGMRREQSNVRHRDLAAIRKIMHTTGKLPLHTHTQEEYKPFINVAYDGSAWVNEGNHRIMAAAELGWPSLPVEISYFDGGERVESGAMYPGKIGLA